MKEIKLTQGKAAIVDNADYEAISQFRWLALKPKIGRRAWYAVTSQGKIVMHRFIMNPPTDKQVDHKNGNGLDNRRDNLRICSNGQNQHNRTKWCGLSKFKGVKKESRRKKVRWGARIKIDGKSIWLGTYKNEVGAAKAYDKAAIKYFGEFALTNKMMGLL